MLVRGLDWDTALLQAALNTQGNIGGKVVLELRDTLAVECLNSEVCLY